MDMPLSLWGRAYCNVPEEVQHWLSELEQPQHGAAHSTHLTNQQLIDQLLEQVAQKKDEVESSRSKWTVKVGTRRLEVRKYFNNTIHWIDRFRHIGDVATSYDPVHAALPWAAFRLALKAVVAEKEHGDAVLKLLSAIPRFLFSGQVLEMLYKPGSLKITDVSGMIETDHKALDGLHEDIVALYCGVLKAMYFCFTFFESNGVKRKVRAFFESSKPADILEEVELQHRNLLSRGDMCEKIFRARLSDDSLSLLQKYQTTMNEIRDQASQILVWMEDKERLDTLEEISALRFMAHHRDVSLRRTKTTCEWILQRQFFTEWLDGSTPIAVLYGEPGAGKTFLMSKIVDHALQSAKQDEAVAFFYCKRDYDTRRTPENILRSLLRQLSACVGQDKLGLIHPAVRGLPKRLRAEGSAFDALTCKTLMGVIVKDYSRITILLDALDECDRSTRKELMEILSDLAREHNHLRLMFSSRTDDDICRHFQSEPAIEIQSTDNEGDIRTFTQESLSKETRWQGLATELQREIEAVLQAGSQGMFQWAALQVQRLRELRVWNESNIREQLRTVPKGLDGAYDMIWNSIKQMPDYEQKMAMRAFQWVLCAYRPLTTEEISVAMMIDPDSDSLDSVERLPREVILSVCGNLLRYDQTLEVWGFCHLSASEYVKKYHYDKLTAHLLVAMSSLKYLIAYLPEKGNGRLRDSPNRAINPIGVHSAYICCYVLQHAKKLDDLATEESRLVSLLKTFLGSVQKPSVAYKHWIDEAEKAISNRREESWLLISGCPRDSPLSAMATFGLFNSLRALWEGATLRQLNAKGWSNPLLSPLFLATVYRNEAICHYLIQRGVSIDDNSRSCLSWATDYHDESTPWVAGDLSAWMDGFRKIC